MTDLQQDVIEEHYNDNEFGLYNPVEREQIAVGFSKVFSYLFGRDKTNRIWRALRTDINGNLKITSGTQAINAPQATAVTPISVANGAVLSANPLRKSFMIINDNLAQLAPDNSVVVKYPSPSTSAGIRIPPGYAYIDDTWAGDVFMLQNSGTAQVTIIEYY